MSKSTGSQLVEMTIDKVVGLHKDQNQTSHFVVLNELGGDRPTDDPDRIDRSHRPSGQPGGAKSWPAIRRSSQSDCYRRLEDSVRRVRIDRLIDVPKLGVVYGATVEVEGASAVNEADARPSDALNLAAVVRCPVAVTVEVLEEAAIRRANDSSEAHLLRRSFDAEPMRMCRQAG